jgi:DNA-binding transcriptional LysR family regulator
MALTAAGELALREFAEMVNAFDAAVDRVASAAPAVSQLRLADSTTSWYVTLVP